MQLFLIGISKHYQRMLRTTPRENFQGPAQRVTQACKCFKIKAIAEVTCLEAQDEKYTSLSVEVAKNLNITHIFCDPVKAPYELLERSSERYRFLAEQQEIIWLSEVEKTEFPVLFLCAPNHVDSFAKKCKGNAMNVMLLERNWAPSIGLFHNYEKIGSGSFTD